MIRASIIGASGYTGLELLRILSNHPDVKITNVTWSQDKTENISKIFPGLAKIIDCDCSKPDIQKIGKTSDVVFLAVPHVTAMDYAEKLFEYNVKIIDLSADFRLNDPGIYEYWYKEKHKCPHLLNSAVYGLPELYRDKIKNSKLIANPGCYPTCSILGLAPLLKNLIIDDDIIIDAKSGVSGAGKKLSDRTHFSETNDNFLAYSLSHRHLPEIEQELNKISEEPVNLTFIPHLIPINRGMLCTIYVKPQQPADENSIYNIYNNFYHNEHFVRIVPNNTLPETKFVKYSNFCDIGIHYDKRSETIIIISCIDNICKGASGQAVQNMNIMFNLKETSGLNFCGIYP
ncbi:N-acetyl-gamma-glutamyl-phosphate reductase [Candidatus Dependentiae bacterium]|nr:N-acetyl-gamma-glutamyl-phosphate reductase [Candidatus Dependentiae bacterium]